MQRLTCRPVRATAILVTRFLLDLRSIYYVDTSSDGTETTMETDKSTTDIRFAASIVGNMGAPLAGKFGESDQGESDDSTLEFSNDPMSTGMLESLRHPDDDRLGSDDAIEMVESRYVCILWLIAGSLRDGN